MYLCAIKQNVFYMYEFYIHFTLCSIQLDEPFYRLIDGISVMKDGLLSSSVDKWFKDTCATRGQHLNPLFIKVMLQPKNKAALFIFKAFLTYATF